MCGCEQSNNLERLKFQVTTSPDLIANCAFELSSLNYNKNADSFKKTLCIINPVDFLSNKSTLWLRLWLINHNLKQSDELFREIASFIDGAPREHVQTLTWRTKPEKGAGVMQMRQIGHMQINKGACTKLGTERTSSPYVNLTAHTQLRGELQDQTSLSKDFMALCGLKRCCG